MSQAWTVSAAPHTHRRSQRVLRFGAVLIAAAAAYAAAAAIAPGFNAPALAGETESAAASTAPDTVAATTVRIDNFTFAPATLTIPVGTTVTWVNADDIPHVVSEKNRAFKSKTLDTDDKFSFTFSTPGTIEYFCTLHPHMVGKIIVQASQPAS
jgi:plastocyanin